MIYYLTLPLCLLLLVVIQHTVPGVFLLNSGTVEMSLIVVIYAGFRLGMIKGGVLTLMLGFIMDCITGVPSGFYILIYFAIFSLSFLVAPRIYAENTVFIILMTFVCGLLEGALIMVFNYLLYGTHLFYDIFRFFLPQLIIVSAISPVFFKFLDRFGIFYGGYARSVRRI